MSNIEEFLLIWFETTQEWLVVFPCGTTMRGCYGSMGYAQAAALEHLGRGECEFECEDVGGAGQVYRYVKDDDFWQAEPAKAGA